MISVNGTLVSEGAGGVYGERMIGEYRVWDPYRSKFAALWYLDGSTDYAEAVYAVEFAPRPMQDLLMVARKRKNIVPIFGDATQPQRYAPLVESVDLVYQDVAQPNQAAIAIRHLPFLRSGGRLILMLKTRSVDVRKSPEEVFADTCRELEGAGLRVVKAVWLLPYHADHAAIVCERV